MEFMLNFITMIAVSVQRSGNYVPSQWAGNDVYASRRLNEVVDAVVISGGRALGQPGDELYHMDVESITTRWTENGTPYHVHQVDSSINLAWSPMYLNIEAQYAQDEDMDDTHSYEDWDVDDDKTWAREEALDN